MNLTPRQVAERCTAIMWPDDHAAQGLGIVITSTTPGGATVTMKVRQDMDIKVPEEIFGIKKWECEVVSNYNVASFIKEFVVKLPPGEPAPWATSMESTWASSRA